MYAIATVIGSLMVYGCCLFLVLPSISETSKKIILITLIIGFVIALWSIMEMGHHNNMEKFSKGISHEHRLSISKFEFKGCIILDEDGDVVSVELIPGTTVPAE
ncbi:MAG: hypothetical protein WAV31_04715 [Candidatus Moraniibacteriota bacterium]